MALITTMVLCAMASVVNSFIKRGISLTCALASETEESRDRSRGTPSQSGEVSVKPRALGSEPATIDAENHSGP